MKYVQKNVYFKTRKKKREKPKPGTTNCFFFIPFRFLIDQLHVEGVFLVGDN